MFFNLFIILSLSLLLKRRQHIERDLVLHLGRCYARIWKKLKVPGWTLVVYHIWHLNDLNNSFFKFTVNNEFESYDLNHSNVWFEKPIALSFFQYYIVVNCIICLLEVNQYHSSHQTQKLKSFKIMPCKNVGHESVEWFFRNLDQKLSKMLLFIKNNLFFRG